MHSLTKLQEIVASYMASLNVDGRPHSLYEPIDYSIAAGGKRIRPMLTVAACGAFADDVRATLPAAAAIEVFHTFTLLHDDIMDNAPMRRGRPSVFGKWGTNAAILSGDAMMIYSYKLLSQVPEWALGRVMERFTYTALTVCEGQQLDMEFEHRTDVSMEEYMEMIDKKTAVLLNGATLVGAIVGGADDEALSCLGTFATELGLAFQLQDDLLDVYGTAEQLGKPIGGDILEAKKSFLLLTALENSTESGRDMLLGMLHNTFMSPDEKILSVRAIYDSLGVKEQTEEHISLHFARAMEALDALQVADERKEPLKQIAFSLLNRKK